MRYTKVFTNISVIVSLTLLVTCSDGVDEVTTRSYPVVDTRDVTDINGNGATFNAEILSIGNGGVIDHGFVYDDQPLPSLELSDKISLGETAEKGNYSILANRNLIKDQEYYVRAYAISKDKKVVVYGQAVNFISQGGSVPEILDFTPRQGVIGDTVILKGSGFSDVIANNNVLFGGVSSKVLKARVDSLWCIIPAITPIGENEVALILGQFTVKANTKFLLKPISLSSFTPGSVSFGDTVTVTGLNFPKDKSMINPTLFGKSAAIANTSSTQLKIVVSNEVVTPESLVSIIAGVQTVSFADKIKLLKPVINNISPQTGTKDSEVTISGNYFSPVKTNNKVQINGADLTVLECSKTFLKVKMLDLKAGEYIMSVTTAEQNVLSDKKFVMMGPIIDNVNPLAATWNDELIITGKGFSLNKADNIVKMGGIDCEVISSTDTQIVIKVPIDLTTMESMISVKIPVFNPYETVFDQSFLLSSPVLFSVSPTQGKSGSIIDIVGENLYPSTLNQIVTFGGFTALVLEASKSKLTVQLPTSLIDQTVGINVTIGDLIATSTSPFHIISPWKQLTSFPDGSFENGAAFNISGAGYVCGTVNELNKLWKYDVASNSWSGKNAINLTGNNLISFSNASFGWAGLPEGYTQQISRYNPSTNDWASSTLFPGPPTNGAMTFTIGGYSYVTNGVSQLYLEGLGNVYSNLVSTYKFNMSSETWTEVAKSPGTPEQINFITGRTDAASFAIGSFGYVFGGRGLASNSNVFSDLLIYDSNLDAWQTVSSTGVPARYKSASFAIGQFGYLIGGYSSTSTESQLSDFWSFDTTSQTWKLLENFPGPARAGAVIFTIGNKAYYGAGRSNSGLLDDFWEFDPSKL